MISQERWLSSCLQSAAGSEPTDANNGAWREAADRGTGLGARRASSLDACRRDKQLAAARSVPKRGGWPPKQEPFPLFDSPVASFLVRNRFGEYVRAAKKIRRLALGLVHEEDARGDLAIGRTVGWGAWRCFARARVRLFFVCLFAFFRWSQNVPNTSGFLPYCGGRSMVTRDIS